MSLTIFLLLQETGVLNVLEILFRFTQMITYTYVLFNGNSANKIFYIEFFKHTKSRTHESLVVS
jgi:hypothetical protein